MVGMLIVGGIVLVAGSGDQAASADRGPVGRYQLVAGTYSVTLRSGAAGKGLNGERAGVFRIDTTTGQTWVLVEEVDTGSIIDDTIDRRWQPIE
jgi:hypothetical protein